MEYIFFKRGEKGGLGLGRPKGKDVEGRGGAGGVKDIEVVHSRANV